MAEHKLAPKHKAHKSEGKRPRRICYDARVPELHQRIDWDVILPEGSFAPVWAHHGSALPSVVFLSRLEGLLLEQDTARLLRLSIELCLRVVGLVRVGLYLYDASRDLMTGTWGTSLTRQIVDEQSVAFTLGESGHLVFARAASGYAPYTVVQDCPIIDRRGGRTELVGRGWVVCTPIRSSQRAFGMLYNDAGLTDATVVPERQEQAAMLATLLGGLLENPSHRQNLPPHFAPTGCHPTVAQVIRMLGEDPSLSGREMAERLHLSLSHLARLFKLEAGCSLVLYRNRLRLDRFFRTVDPEGHNLHAAAKASGFGSYAQFHRVFCATYRDNPSRYLSHRRRRFVSGDS